MSPSNSPILSAATIWPIHVFSSAFSAFLSANILRPCFWRSCNPGPTLQASVMDESMTWRMLQKRWTHVHSSSFKASTVILHCFLELFSLSPSSKMNSLTACEMIAWVGKDTMTIWGYIPLVVTWHKRAWQKLSSITPSYHVIVELVAHCFNI